MTLLISSKVTLPAQARPPASVSLPRLFCLLVGLRFVQWKNRARHLLDGVSRRSLTDSSRRTATVSSTSADAVILLSFSLLIALLCLQAFDSFQAIAASHGALGLEARATMLSSVLTLSVFMTGLAGDGGSDRDFERELDFLLTLPVPGWCIQAAKLLESALMHPLSWMLLFPFFTGLGLYAGLSLAAPFVAFAFCLVLFAFNALLARLIGLIARRFLRGSTFRVVRGVISALGALVLVTHLATPALARLGLPLLGQWVDLEPSLGWLPFAEPARVITTLLHSPGQALSRLALFALEMGAAFALGALAISRTHAAMLLDGDGVRRSARCSERVTGRAIGASWIPGVLVKDWLWLRRNPVRVAGLVANGLLANVLASVLLHRIGGAQPLAALSGAALFGVGVWQLTVLSVLVECDRVALPYLCTLSRPISRVFAEKSAFAVALACASALPAAIYTSHALPSSLSAQLPGLIYAASGLCIYGYIATALWLRGAGPSAGLAALRHAVRGAQLLTLAGFFAAGFAFPSLARALPLLVLSAALAFTLWQDWVARVPFALDPSARQAPVPLATHAILAIIAMRLLQVQALQIASALGLAPGLALLLSFVTAGGSVALVMVSLLALRRVPHWREALGVGGGAGIGVCLREGLIWGIPAVVVNFGFVWTMQREASAEWFESARNAPLFSLATAPNTVVYVALTTLAAPLLEEILFRGMLYRALRSRSGVATSTLLSAAVFTAVHPGGGAIPIFCLGIGTAMALERSRSLLAPVIVHAVYNGAVAWALLGA